MHSLPFAVSTRRLIAGGLLAVALAFFAARQLSHHAAAASAAGPAPAPVRAVAAAPSVAEELVVDVEGAVRRPGLIHLPKGSRVADALARAGGLTAKADRAGVNLAAPVSDGQQVLVPVSGGGGVAASTGDGVPSPTAPISLSSATVEQLDTLPGVGPVTAQKIVAYREQHGAFQSVDELDAIPGIGPARISELKGLVTP